MNKLNNFKNLKVSRDTATPPLAILPHERTIAEESFLVWLLLFLKDLNFSGEVHCRCFLVNRIGRSRRPDFYIPRYGLPIEIDGCTRDVSKKRAEDRSPRDEFYESIGSRPPLIIPANWVVSWEKMSRTRKELRKFLFSERLGPKTRNKINKHIHDGRKEIASKFPELARLNGKPALQFCPDLGLHGFKEFHHFGGTKFTLRARDKNKSLIEYPDSDLSQSYFRELSKRGQLKEIDTLIKSAAAGQDFSSRSDDRIVRLTVESLFRRLKRQFEELRQLEKGSKEYIALNEECYRIADIVLYNLDRNWEARYSEWSVGEEE